MGEKRKASFTILLRKQGKRKTHKIELYPATMWGGSKSFYRIRVDGKWFQDMVGKKLFKIKHQIKDILWNSIKDHF